MIRRRCGISAGRANTRETDPHPLHHSCPCCLPTKQRTTSCVARHGHGAAVLPCASRLLSLGCVTQELEALAAKHSKLKVRAVRK